MRNHKLRATFSTTALTLFFTACAQPMATYSPSVKSADAQSETTKPAPKPKEGAIAPGADDSNTGAATHAGANSNTGNDSIESLPDPAPASMPIPTQPPAAEIEKIAGCSAAGDLPEGEATVSVNGKTWKYILRKPAKYTKDKSWPLVLALHPNGGNSSYWDGTAGARAIRPLFGDKAIIMVAQALGGDWRTDLAAGRLYFDASIKKLKENLCVDTKRIFSMGFSGGGSFSGDLGCNRSDIRAIASGGAVEYFDPKTCVGKPAVWVTIGDDEAEAARIAFRDFWKTYNQCKDQTTVLDPKTCVAYACPVSDRLVNFCSHGGGHEWPNFGIKTAWDFFSQF